MEEILEETSVDTEAKLLQLSVPKASLLKALSRAQAIVERRPTIAILSHIKLVAKLNELQITATNMDTSTVEKVIDVASAEDGQVTVAAHTLHEIIRKLPEDSQITLAQDKSSGNLNLNSGSSHFSLVTIPPSQFPQSQEETFESNFLLSKEQCQLLFGKASLAISREETRYYLCGLYLHAYNKKLRSVATDGHRLVQAEIDLPEEATDMHSVIIPRKTVTEVIKIINDDIEDIELSISKSKIRFTAGNLTLTSKLIDSTFPDYTKVIPKSTENNPLTVQVASFKDAIDRVSSICSEKTRAIKLTITNNLLTLSAKSDTSSIAREAIKIDYIGEEMEIGFNAIYLLDILSNIDDELAHCEFGNNNNPTVIKDKKNDTVLFIIMPMRM
ncbi:DNA polymerase III subunit beta [Rickettsiales bacterium]|nr:DNA polymerase III subunit beta [Rickettsiales bacterium]